jgi:hypothetical protein
VRLSFYFDHNMNRAIASGLRSRGVDVLLASEDGNARLDDESLLERATSLGRVLVSEDKDFMAITTRWLLAGKHFAGVIRAPKHLPIGRVIADLELIAGVLDAEEFVNRVEHLPLR